MEEGSNISKCTRVEEPARQKKITIPKLAILSSPYRFVVQPIVDHVLEIEKQNKDRTIAVVIPQLVEPHCASSRSMCRGTAPVSLVR
jgi:hypothetical protein